MTNDLRTSIVAAIEKALHDHDSGNCEGCWFDDRQHNDYKPLATIAYDAAWPLIVAADPEEKGLVPVLQYHDRTLYATPQEDE